MKFMNIRRTPVGAGQYLFELLNNYEKKKNSMFQENISVKKKDTLYISEEAKEMLQRKSKSKCQKNINADKSIDLKKYVEEARKQNEKALENAGTSIDETGVPFIKLDHVLFEAVKKKYAMVSAEAAGYSNREEYLSDKYENKDSPIYETGLSDTERWVAYRNEKVYLEQGKINEVYADSLLRGCAIYGNVTEDDLIQWYRRVVNKQIGNIMQQAGINMDTIGDQCQFTVDPYNFYITVSGVNDEQKIKMENALNVGNNGKELFYHICNSIKQDGCHSTQITEQNQLKYRVSAQITEFTGINILDLTEKEDSFYTKDGKNILELVNKGIQEKVPYGFQDDVKEWVADMVEEVLRTGWDNIPDMTLSIGYTKNGLRDIKQDIIFTGEKSQANNAWYSVLGNYH